MQSSARIIHLSLHRTRDERGSNRKSYGALFNDDEVEDDSSIEEVQEGAETTALLQHQHQRSSVACSLMGSRP